MVVLTTVEAVDMDVIRRDMWIIIHERERLVNTGFAGDA